MKQMTLNRGERVKVYLGADVVAEDVKAETLAAAPDLLAAADALLREIMRRDGEGNLIPAHLYSPLLRAIVKAGGAR